MLEGEGFHAELRGLWLSAASKEPETHFPTGDRAAWVGFALMCARSVGAAAYSD